METRPPQQPRTAPEELPDARARHEAFASAAAVTSGVATGYWLELVAYPPGSARSLWLLVDGTWRHLDNPSAATQDSVQEAFCECPERLEVVVWYDNDVIVGLVVRSR
jgi:hypothetical protein